MEWIKVSEQYPNQFEEVIACLSDGTVKAVTYIGDHKWTTYRTVVLWAHMPETPLELLNDNDNIVSEAPKRRGRKKKIKEE